MSEERGPEAAATSGPALMELRLPTPLWVDQLTRKHEYAPSRYGHEISVRIDGRAITVLAPILRVAPERMEIKTTIASEGLLVLIARHTVDDGDDPCECGLVMIATKTADSRYEVHVWHELYPATLKLLGL